ncbi:hypothetical protein [Adhaeribacter pallidiroseus]|uniref:Uncharacterized protein n=1 Tax=Adhaeribacter pallidiroseus TaxID=2072847 RepID=A0A369QDY8_9BACT|nr:hypothetical protein [Adhaeribacter pallidiroseus]RDC62934.1 hypothetical protein AHMF7616_01533 [Adhaeribacter pallidiroseus]
MFLLSRLGILLVLIFLFSSCRPSCPIASCAVRKVHHHGGKIYRGQPLWKKQNPHIGEDIPQDTKEKPNFKQNKRKEKVGE